MIKATKHFNARLKLPSMNPSKADDDGSVMVTVSVKRGDILVAVVEKVCKESEVAVDEALKEKILDQLIMLC